MSNENKTLIKELGIFLTIVSEKKTSAIIPVMSQWVTLTYFGVDYDDQGNKNCITLHDVS